MDKTVITFGTDGFRGIIAREFTFETVERIISAINLYIKNSYKRERTILVGYDPRFMARDFAKFGANLLKNYGFKVVLSSKIVPTPIMAYQAKNYPDSIGAIMFTASHNPKEYQGIKFIPNYAGPATKKITDEILKYVDCTAEFKEGGTLIEKSFEEEYFKHLDNLIDFEAIKNNAPKIVFDGLYSASIGYFDKILDRHGIKYDSYNMYHSPDFGGGLPEPKPKFMKCKNKGYVTMANDGDADRYGVIDENGDYVSPNIVMAILLKYLHSQGKKGHMIKTVGVSSLIDIVAQKLGIETITTPVGFKWLSEAMRKDETILAGEDSGGLSTGEHIPEKDGIYANLLILEAMAKENKKLTELVKDIMSFADCEFFTDRVDVELENSFNFERLMEKFNKIIQVFDMKIVSKMTIDGLKLFLEDNVSSLLIRKSGTEPLLRFYIESDSLEKVEKIKKFVNANI
ncbi:phosphoglucomutase/phosphomannomutase family protein [bacterium]|nr:phosphoglucomutase/phosphomannomutase family protein [bacterium]